VAAIITVGEIRGVAIAWITPARTGNDGAVKTHRASFGLRESLLGMDSQTARSTRYFAVEIRFSFTVNRKMKLCMLADRQIALVNHGDAT
jgi:hypothetical protein